MAVWECGVNGVLVVYAQLTWTSSLGTAQHVRDREVDGSLLPLSACVCSKSTDTATGPFRAEAGTTAFQRSLPI